MFGIERSHVLLIDIEDQYMAAIIVEIFVDWRMHHSHTFTAFAFTGARAGFWRLYTIFTSKKVPCTVFAVGMALERNPEAGKAMVQAGMDVSDYDYHDVVISIACSFMCTLLGIR